MSWLPILPRLVGLVGFNGKGTTRTDELRSIPSLRVLLMVTPPISRSRTVDPYTDPKLSLRHSIGAAALENVDGAPPHFEILTAMQNGVVRRWASTTVAAKLSNPGLRHPRLRQGTASRNNVSEADASDDHTTFVIEIVRPTSSVSGASGAARVIAIPPLANDDDRTYFSRSELRLNFSIASALGYRDDSSRYGGILTAKLIGDAAM